MNIRKPVDYSALFTELEVLLTKGLPQLELYCQIGRLISGRPEKGVAIAAAEYLQGTYPDASGFSPRNLRRMRAFYCAYGSGDADRLDTECGYIGGRTYGSGKSVVSSGRSSVWLVQGETAAADCICRALAFIPRLAG